MNMCEKTKFHYYEATTLPSTAGASAALSRASTSAGSGNDGGLMTSVAVKVAAGAGDRCVAHAASRPKRRVMIHNSDTEDSDTLNMPAVQWTTTNNSPEGGISVSQLAADYRTQLPLLVKVTEDTPDFSRGQVS